MPDIQAHLADGTTLHFPDGTDPSVIQRVVKSRVGQSVPIGGLPSFDPSKAQALSPGAIGGGITQAPPAPDTSGFFKTLTGDVGAAVKPLNPMAAFGAQKVTDPAEAERVAYQERRASGQGPARAITEGIAETGFGGNMQGFDEAVRNNNLKQAIAHLIVPATQAGLMERGLEGATATDMPAAGKSAADLKIGVADAAYKRGLGVSEKFNQASDAIHNEVSNLAQTVSQKIDAAHPEGAIDAKPIIDRVNQVKADIVKTPQNYPAGLGAMLEPEAQRSSGPMVGGRRFDLSNPSDLKAWNRMKAQGVFTPQQIARTEGTGSDKWTFDEAKQWRSKIGAAMANTEGPMKPVLREAYGDLSQQMRSSAENSGALGEYTRYNQLHQKHMRFLEDPTVKKIMGGVKSDQTLKPLSDPEDMAHLDNILQDWKKYGIDSDQLRQEGTDYGKAQAILARKHFRWFPGGTIGGAVGGHLLGIGYMPGAAAGIALDRAMSGTGQASRFIESSKISPFYDSGVERAGRIAQGFNDLPEIAARKVAIKAQK